MRIQLIKKSKFIFIPLLIIIADLGFSNHQIKPKMATGEKFSLYNELNLSTIGLKETIFDKAIAGYNKLFKKKQLHNQNMLSIVDLSQSSNSKRLYVIDIKNKKVLFNTYAAHGRNSGEEFASSFANQAESFKSSLGFYITAETYNGAHGLSLRLQGVEKGINDKAEKRGIVLHGAPYVSDSFIQQNGRLGRSLGCPAVPAELCKPIAESIKQGACFFMFYPDSMYLKSSLLL